jgi:hypothetical protein
MILTFSTTIDDEDDLVKVSVSFLKHPPAAEVSLLIKTLEETGDNVFASNIRLARFRI